MRPLGRKNPSTRLSDLERRVASLERRIQPPPVNPAVIAYVAFQNIASTGTTQIELDPDALSSNTNDWAGVDTYYLSQGTKQKDGLYAVWTILEVVTGTYSADAYVHIEMELWDVDGLVGTFDSLWQHHIRPTENSGIGNSYRTHGLFWNGGVGVGQHLRFRVKFVSAGGVDGTCGGDLVVARLAEVPGQFTAEPPA